MSEAKARIRTQARLFGTAVCLALSSVGCLTLPEGYGASDGGPRALPCKNVPLCEVLSLADVNAALGGSFDDRLPGFENESGPDVYADSCKYDRPPTAGLYVQRFCFVDAGAATARFDAVRADLPLPSPPGARIEVTGVGDEAFFDDNSGSSDGRNPAALHAIKDNVVVDLSDSAVVAGEDAQAGFVTLAKTILAR